MALSNKVISLNEFPCTAFLFSYKNSKGISRKILCASCEQERSTCFVETEKRNTYFLSKVYAFIFKRFRNGKKNEIMKKKEWNGLLSDFSPHSRTT